MAIAKVEGIFNMALMATLLMGLLVIGMSLMVTPKQVAQFQQNGVRAVASQ